MHSIDKHKEAIWMIKALKLQYRERCKIGPGSGQKQVKIHTYYYHQNDDEWDKQCLCPPEGATSLPFSVLPFFLHNPTCVGLQYPTKIAPRLRFFVPATVANDPYPRLHLAFRPGRCLNRPSGETGQTHRGEKKENTEVSEKQSPGSMRDSLFGDLCRLMDVVWWGWMGRDGALRSRWFSSDADTSRPPLGPRTRGWCNTTGVDGSGFTWAEPYGCIHAAFVSLWFIFCQVVHMTFSVRPVLFTFSHSADSFIQSIISRISDTPDLIRMCKTGVCVIIYNVL